ncbi:hypothetical protein ACOME3_009506 [Neoechinorhynchus agilis]
MALSEQAALLDELMGKDRNAIPGQQTRDHDFRDREVCKHYLCGFCPHQLFTNTRADLGPCHLIHDDSLRRTYQSSDLYGHLGYEDSFEILLKKLLNEVEKRIRKGEDRLRLTQSDDPSSLMTNTAEAMLPPNQVRLERLKSLNDQINSLIHESERLGMEGNIDHAKEILSRIEKLKCERYELETRMPGNDNVKAMEVCTVCGSFLIVGDAQCRVDEHITGKQHLGYARIREMLDSLRKKREEGVFKFKEENEVHDIESRNHLCRDERKSRGGRYNRSPSKRYERRRSRSPHDRYRYQQRESRDEPLVTRKRYGQHNDNFQTKNVQYERYSRRNMGSTRDADHRSRR